MSQKIAIAMSKDDATGLFRVGVVIEGFRSPGDAANYAQRLKAYLEDIEGAMLQVSRIN